MTFEFIVVSITAGIAAIKLNRPDKRNAMHGQMIQELLSSLQFISQDKTVRVVIIQGNGEYFCAGADINWMQHIATGTYQENLNDAKALADLMYQLYIFPKPTIVLAHGVVLGGGLGLLACCDIAIAAKNTIFGFSEVKIGITPSTISPYVIAAIGERAAHYYFLTGERFNSVTALQMGLVHIVSEDDAVVETGTSLAKSLLRNSPNALIEAKKLIKWVAHEKISPGLAQKTAEHLAGLRASSEAQEGLKAFTEKRLPNWSE